MISGRIFAAVAKGLTALGLWFCASSVLVAELAAQCTSTPIVPNQTISSGTACYSTNDMLTAATVIINGSADVSFVAGRTVHLTPGFRATGGTAATTFQAWVETVPTAVWASPSGGTGLTQAFTWTVSNPAGYGEIAEVQAIFNTALSGWASCYIRYSRGSNSLYLADDSGTVWLGGFAPGSIGSASNSRCSITGSGASVTGSGTQLALTATVTFQAGWAGLKNQYLNVYDSWNLSSGWQTMGTWNVGSGGTQYYLTTAASPAGGGTISPPSGWYNSGAVVTVSAAANSGYQFAGFSGALSGTTTPQYLTMDGNKSVTANFSPTGTQYQLTTTVSPSGGGTITPNCASGCMYNSGQVVTITAEAATGYVFSGYGGSLSGTTNPQNLPMNGPKSVTANFSPGGTPDFTLNLPAGVTVEAGFQSSFLLNIVPQGGFSSAVTWTVTPSLAGVSAIWAANSQPALSATTATATLTAQAPAPRGAYQVTVTATGGGIQHSATIPMTVVWPLRAQSETNMGPVIFREYTYSHGLSQHPFLQTTCPANPNMRACHQQIMAAYQIEGISGVRFMFDLSEALNPDQTVDPTWVSNVQAFFKDLHDHGIYKITPNIREWVVDSQYQYSSTLVARDGCTVPNYYLGATQIRFSRTAPYGEVYRGSDWTWDGNGAPGGAAYYCAMANPYFAGWSRIFDIVDALLQAARDNALTVQEFDGINEIQLSSFAVRGRLIVDNTNSDYDVLGTIGTGLRSLRQSMQAHGFDPGRVTYSVIGVNAQQPRGECPADPANPLHPYFGDSGRLLDLSILTAAIGVGGPFGSMNVSYDLPAGDWSSGTALPCGGSALGAAYLPISHASPTAVDVHSGPCVVIKRTGTGADATNGWGECDPSQWSNVHGEAQQMGDDMAVFLNSFNNGWRGYNANLASAIAVLGETHGRLKPATPGSQYTACKMSTVPGQLLYDYYWAVSTGLDTYSGFNNSTLATWLPSNGLPATIVFRPWEYLLQYDDPQASACNTINTNPPYAPRQ